MPPTFEYCLRGFSRFAAGQDTVRLELRHRSGRVPLRLRRPAPLTARRRRQIAAGADPDAAAEVLALLAHGVNLRSRAGADAQQLQRTAAAAIDAVTGSSGP
ncbi:hypothetical protein [Streptomyces mirabilis]|uniref:TetR family transcriptional regulator n=1 Tax=Streptomyces mirabilis TaxID=68239 RepID=A0ABU3UHY0_9ACTN|nr:hypothetical protein [Streptomyces mirabilis]MCX4612765.1 hypothetical protein [Streptomyces mirabilis]MCX5352993.1 hypothetical protein [Streptomyces mirabilis]MDU8993532.1 hypothetical protein [Streptomyces mirabilis]